MSIIERAERVWCDVYGGNHEVKVLEYDEGLREVLYVDPWGNVDHADVKHFTFEIKFTS